MPKYKNQAKTIELIKKLDSTFYTKDLARIIHPQYFFRGDVWIDRKNKEIWANSREILINVFGVNEVDAEKYNFRRRAIMTTSSKLKCLEEAGFVTRIKGKKVKWKLNQKTSDS